ncbi:MAG: glutamate 5-kinase [Verrucomicrobiota bacterium]
MDEDKKRIVIKIGSGVLAQEEGVCLDLDIIARLARAIAGLNQAGHQCLVVSSGAVAAGLDALGLDQRPSSLETLQACAAAGQARLMHHYEGQFSQQDSTVAQILLSHEDLANQQRRINVKNTLTHLLEFPGVIPIINENDSVAIYELKVGDNDRLSTDIAVLAEADLLIMLTSVPGLRGPDARDDNDIIKNIPDVSQVLSYASAETGRLSIGGMRSKLECVKTAVEAGIETLIASGRHPEQLLELVNGGGLASRFPVPAKTSTGN